MIAVSKREYSAPSCAIYDYGLEEDMLQGSNSGEIGQGKDNEPTYSKAIPLVDMSSDDDDF